ncbi:hypothetical protein DFH28DRAFT_1129870 [Melampsora americana]|nr:hypothetical protein DFH28DRAFT_1129870 [Melampsora americana]
MRRLRKFGRGNERDASTLWASRFSNLACIVSPDDYMLQSISFRISLAIEVHGPKEVMLIRNQFLRPSFGAQHTTTSLSESMFNQQGVDNISRLEFLVSHVPSISYLHPEASLTIPKSSNRQHIDVNLALATRSIFVLRSGCSSRHYKVASDPNICGASEADSLDRASEALFRLRPRAAPGPSPIKTALLVCKYKGPCDPFPPP